MKFTFKIQQYQTDAVKSVTDVFRGQPYKDAGSYLKDPGREAEFKQQAFRLPGSEEDRNLEDLMTDTGFKNPDIVLNDDQILKNIHAV